MGRGFYLFPPVQICGSPGAASGYLRGDLWQHGFCGKATALTQGEDGAYYAEQYQYTPWGTPWFYHQISGTEMEVRSAGPDRRLWTGDDLVMK